MFHEGDLQSGIGLAVQQSKAVLCFVHDDKETSAEWETILRDSSISQAVTSQTVALRLLAGSEEAGFLTPICAINSAPAIVVIKNAQVQTNLQSDQVSAQQLRQRLASALGIQEDGSAQTAEEPNATRQLVQASESACEYLDLQLQSGQMKLPNNAYDALRSHTQNLLDEGTAPSAVFQTQLALLSNIPIFNDEVKRLRGDGARRELSEYARSRLLRLPAVGLKIPGQSKSASAVASPSTSSRSQHASPPSDSQAPASAGERVYSLQTPATPSSNPQSQSQTDPVAAPSRSPPSHEPNEKQNAQRAEYIKMQREREQKAHDERERIKAQIKADREERRRLDELRKQSQQPTSERDTTTTSSSSYARAGTSRTNHTVDVRLQVRTFDGSTLRTTFAPTSTITDKVRPWIDSSTNSNIPYNLKLILTPLPNRTIEAGEEDTPLSDLGIRGSCTFVMVPVQGYVESYSGGRAGLMGQNGLLGGVGGMVSGGYNLVSGTAGWALGGVRSLLGYGQQAETGASGSTVGGAGVAGESAGGAQNVRIRTLADQRAEEAKKDRQFYNGNQLNFEPNKDEDGKKD